MAKNTLRRPLLRKVVRGYSPEQVDLFVSRAIDRVASLNRENESLRRRLDDALSEIEKLKAENGAVALPAEDGEAAREALTDAAETLLSLAEKFGAKKDAIGPDEIEVEVFVEEPQKTGETGEPYEPAEEVYYEEDAEEAEGPAAEIPADFAGDAGADTEEIFYEEEIEDKEENTPAVEEPNEEEEEEEKEKGEEDTIEVEENPTEEIEKETEEIAEEIPKEEKKEEGPEGTGGEEDGDLLARLKESLNFDGPDFPDDPLANLTEQENGKPGQSDSYEDFSFTELLRGVMGDKPANAAAETPAEETPAETPAEEAGAPAENAVPSSPDELDFYDDEEHEDGEDFDPTTLIRRNRPGRDFDNK